jgi:membrane-associated protease RseP (regulator of RpoE activity)
MPSSRLALCLVALLTGCGNLQVIEGGPIDPGVQPLPAGLFMSFDRLGDATIALRPVDLPKGRELERFGLTVVDVAPLHRLVPAHVAPHRIVVSSLERPSPLAAAGLRPFDVVVAVDGQPVTTIEDVIPRLAAKEPGEPVTLTVIRPDGARGDVTAEAAEQVLTSSSFKLPLLVERQSSGSGHSLGLGPIDMLFYYRAVTEHRALPPQQRVQPTEENPFPPAAAVQAMPSRSRFARRFEWGTLLNLLLWESVTDLQSGAERSRLRVLWVLSFGDDLEGETAP